MTAFEEPQVAPEVSAPVAVSGYEILGELGRGGMAVVYKARHLALNRLVALKLLLPETFAGEQELARFRLEAEAVARMQHPNIVKIYEVGEHAGQLYCALELVEGGSLETNLGGKPLPPRPAALLAETLARAVEHAHQQQIVHRDLKPANVLLSFSREPPASAHATLTAGARLNEATPKITDFGLAKLLDAGSGQTRSGDVLGTPSYMAPEQGEGDIRKVGAATDIHALGAILYEMLTGRPPYRGEGDFETVLQVINQDPVPPSRLQPGVPRDLETICLKCLEKEPGKRYGGAGHLADDLRRFLNDEPIHARPAGRLRRLGKWARRHPAAAALVIVTFVAGLTLFLGAVLATLSLRAERDRAASHFARAVQAVEDMLTELDDPQLAEDPWTKKKRRQLLEKALAYCTAFLADEAVDEAPAAQTALICKRRADIMRLLERPREAKTAYREAIDRLRPLADADSRRRLVECERALAGLSRD
jgi:hypothetical protein